MPLPLSRTAARWREALAGERPVTGMWVASGSPVVAEICAGSGVDPTAFFCGASVDARAPSVRITIPRALQAGTLIPLLLRFI